jgi:hypothetical protein
MKNTSPNDDHGSLTIYRRRWTAYFAFPFAVALLIAGIASAVIAYYSFTARFGIAVAGLCLFSAVCIGFSVGRSSWIALTNKDPALVVDSRGIADHFHLDTFFAWSDIEAASVDYGDGDSLAIVLREGAAAPGGRLVERSLTRSVKRAFTGSDLQIPLGSLTYNPNKLRTLLTYHMKASRSPSP